MNIQIYYAKEIGVPFQEFQLEDTIYEKVWEGTSADLEIYQILDDDKVLEIVFNKFNLEHRPKNFRNDERALSIGDVVSVDYRTYLCDTIGWKRITNFNLIESQKK